MSAFTNLFLLFCLYQSSQSKLSIRFHTVPTCQNVTGVWCVRVYHLAKSFGGPRDPFTNLSSTERNCFFGTDSPSFDVTVIRYVRPFCYAVGFRHNCTSDGSIQDWVAKDEKIQLKIVNEDIKTVVDLKDKLYNGNTLFHDPIIQWESLFFDLV